MSQCRRGEDEEMDFFPFFRPEFPIFHGSFNAADEDDADAVSKPTRFDSKGGGGGKEEKGGNTVHSVCVEFGPYRRTCSRFCEYGSKMQDITRA